MLHRHNHQIEELNRIRREERRNLRLRSLAGFGAVFVVLYSFLLPAFTMEKPSYCGYEEHTHTEECYEYVLDCPVTGETGTVISAEEFRKLPGAEEAEAAFDKAENAEDTKRETASHIHTADIDDDVVVSRATEKADSSRREKADSNRSDSRTASPSDFSEEGTDFYFEHDHAGSGLPDDQEFETESFAVVESNGAVEYGFEEEYIISEADADVSYEEDLTADEAEEDVIIDKAEESACVDTEELITDEAAEPADGTVEAAADTEELADDSFTSDDESVAALEDTLAETDSTYEYEAQSDSEAAQFTEAGFEAPAVPADGSSDVAVEEITAGTHVHTAACYKRVCVCGMEAHVHGLECFIDPEADVEDEALLEDLFPTFEESGSKDSYEYAAKLAEFQKGYRESVKNYMILVDEDDEETMQGYTRYGDWAGDAYAADWSALFASFTAERAGLDIEGYDREMLMDAYSWMQLLRDRAVEEEEMTGTDSRVFREVEDYIGIRFSDYLEEDEDGREILSRAYYEEGHPAAPTVGELVFLDLDGDFDADHVGIITNAALSKNKMTVIVGDIDGFVREEKYSFDDMQILGYARLPETKEAIGRNRSLGFEEDEELPTEEDEADAEMRRRFELARDYPAQEFDDRTETMQVSVSAKVGTFPAGTTMVLTDIYDEETLSVIAGAIEEGRKVKSVQAVDITFYNEYGEEIEPLLPVQVRMTSLEEKQAAADQLSVVHLDNEGSTEIMKEEAISPENSLEASIEIKGTETESTAAEIEEITKAGTEETDLIDAETAGV